MQEILTGLVSLAIMLAGIWQKQKIDSRKEKAQPLIEQAPEDMRPLLQQAAPKVSSPFFAAFVHMANTAVAQQARIDELESSVMGKIEELSNQLAEKEKRIAELESRLSDVTTERDALQAEVDQLRAEVAELRRQLGVEE